MTELQKSKGGRPRKHATDTERKRAYRRRRGIPARQFRPVGNAPIRGEQQAPKSRSAIQRAYRDKKRGFESHRIKGVLPVPNTQNCKNCTDEHTCGRCAYAWNAYLCSVELPAPNNSNFYMKDAPQGCGRFVTGGYDRTKLDLVNAANVRQTARPTNHDSTFAVSHEDRKSADGKDGHEAMMTLEAGMEHDGRPIYETKIPDTRWTNKHNRIVATTKSARLEAQLKELEALPPDEITRREQELGMKPGEYLAGYREQLRRQRAKAGL